ncbi:MAG: deoxyhypusine synthase [Candidatus Hadarchaeota archaeon]
MLKKKMPVRKNKYFRDKVKIIEVAKGKRVSSLLHEMAQTGFQGKKLGEVAEIWAEMVRQKDLTIFMGLTGSMSTAGMWKIVCWLIENRYIDILISTGANISEDIFAGMGGTYWQGSHLVDDAKLYEEKIDRFYDVFADEYQYREMEHMLADFMSTLDTSHCYSSREFMYLLGKELHKSGIPSIATSAYKAKVPIFSPAIIDSGYGVAAMHFMNRGHHIEIDQVKDMEEATKVAINAKRTGVIYVGGGVPKDFTQLLAVIQELKSHDDSPHDYAIQITTDSPQWGGLSGCTLEEAISWGKTSPGGKNAVCYCDATIALPLISHALAETAGKRANCPDFSKIFDDM